MKSILEKVINIIAITLDIDESKLSKVSYLYFTGYMWDTESQKSAIKKAIKLSKDFNIQIVFDVADPFVVGRNKKEFLKMIQNDIDILFANKSEVTLLLDSGNMEQIIDTLTLMITKAGIKIGDKGAYIIDKKNKYRIYPNLIEAIDTTGAGDMYAAGFLSGIANNFSSIKSGKIAGILAEEIIQQFGAQFTQRKIADMKMKLFRSSK